PAAGRPLRLLLLVGMGLGVWIMLRLPILERDAARAEHALRPDPANAASGRFQLASASGDEAPANFAVAEAEVGVARARLALAEAQLRLLQAQRGGYVPPAGPAPAPMVAYVPQPLPPGYAIMPVRAAGYDYPPARRPRMADADGAPIPDYGYALPRHHRADTQPHDLLADAAPAPATAPASAASPPPGHGLATQAYARLAAGDRREASRLFDAALATPPGPTEDPDRIAWATERRRLNKRWSGEIYSLIRDGGAVGPTASPVLGGGQSGFTIGWTANPLARRPVAAVARFNAASDRRGSPDNRSSQAAFGVRWQPVAGVSLTAERLVRIGEFARNDWNLRAAAGADGKRGRIEWNAYGEAGILGAGDVYAGGQARAAMPVFRLQKTRLLGGIGAWGSVQNSAGYALGRFDVGPTLVMRAPLGRTTIDLSADWRFRLAGGALPGSGPAVTLSTGF
ncbi:MAG: hypothetical protein H7268_10155, partial [Sandarakinorhabdus sp.]|nr:hypothetical protein [Sandarakinorhabdus sp.]